MRISSDPLIHVHSSCHVWIQSLEKKNKSSGSSVAVGPKWDIAYSWTNRSKRTCWLPYAIYIPIIYIYNYIYNYIYIFIISWYSILLCGWLQSCSLVFLCLKIWYTTHIYWVFKSPYYCVFNEWIKSYKIPYSIGYWAMFNHFQVSPMFKPAIVSQIHMDDNNNSCLKHLPQKHSRDPDELWNHAVGLDSFSSKLHLHFFRCFFWLFPCMKNYKYL